MKNSMKLLIGLVAICLAGEPAPSQTTTAPDLINYQGVLRDSTGAPVPDGDYDMVLRFYDSDGGAPPCPAGGGNLLLADTHLAANTGAVTVTGGLFNVALGSGNISGPDYGTLWEVFSGHTTVYLEVEVAGEVLCPRVRVLSSAYALNADFLDGQEASDFLTKSAVPQTKLATLTVNALSGTGVVGYGPANGGEFRNTDTTSLVFLARPGEGLYASGTAFGGVFENQVPPWHKVTIGDFLNDVGILAQGFATAAVLDGDVAVTGELTVQGSRVSRADPACFDDANRYVDCGNGTVTDTVTGLIWLADAGCFSVANFAAANNLASTLQDGQCGLTDGSVPGDWRLPTKAEWEATVARAVALGCTLAANGPSLTDTEGTGCFTDETSPLFSGVQLMYDYWSSSSEEVDPSHAWRVEFYGGSVYSWVKFSLSPTALPWPVRGGH